MCRFLWTRLKDPLRGSKPHGTDAHLGQIHIWDRCTFGTDAHLGQMHIYLQKIKFYQFSSKRGYNQTCHYTYDLLLIKLDHISKVEQNWWCSFWEKVIHPTHRFHLLLLGLLHDTRLMFLFIFELLYDTILIFFFIYLQFLYHF